MKGLHIYKRGVNFIMIIEGRWSVNAALARSHLPKVINEEDEEVGFG